MTRHRLGARGEAIAADYLERAGWRILDRNYRVGHGEIDLVATCGGVVAFVEVKTRSGDRFGHPLDSITRRKRAEVGRVASEWITRFGGPGATYRFDAVAVTARTDAPPVVEHVEDAWQSAHEGWI